MNYQNKIIVGGLIGNVVEAYDISICYFLANELSTHLLGSGKNNPTIALTLIFLGYLAKPIGAFFLGLFSDRYGRKRVLAASILLVGISTFLIAFIPPFKSIGIMAAALFLLLRILQSMALGSEYLNSASFLAESGSEKQRGFRGCWPAVGVKAGYLLACLAAGALIWLKGVYPEQDWLWRLPFLLAIVSTLAGYYVRIKIPESLAYVLYYADKPKPDVYAIYRQSLSYIKSNPFLFNYAFFATFFSVATGFFFYLYIPIHAGEYSHFSRFTVLLGTGTSLTLVAALTPLFGWLSDGVGRLKLLTYSAFCILVLAYPLIQSITWGNSVLFIVMMSLISIPCAAYYSASPIILTELFPIQIRCTALSIIYSVAASLAAGIPPLLADYLARKTQWASSPALIIIVLAAIVLLNASFLAKNYQTGRNVYQVNFGFC